MNIQKRLLAAGLSALCLPGAFALSPSSARAQAAAPTKQSVTTYMFDHYQSGVNANESILRPANVTSGTFGALFAAAIDGQAYAQPLYLSNLTVAGVPRNVAYVATMHDSVYAFDADTGAQLWKASFISADAKAAPLITTVPAADLPGSGGSDVDGPEVGIESTPVIDESTGTLYVVAKTKETARGDGHLHWVQRLHALDVATGAEKFNGPQVIGDTTCDNPLGTGSTDTYDFNLAANPQTPSAASSSPTASNYVGGRVYFNALRNLQRCSLTLAGGVVYIGWASHGDYVPYHGWLVGFGAATLLPIPNLVFCDTPAGSKGGIWQGGAGPTIDNDGNLFISTANAPALYCANQTAGNLGESFLRFNPANGLSASAGGFDFWAPGDAPSLGDGDVGVGSGGLVLLDVPGATIQHLCMAGSKSGRIYVVNRDNMGHFVNGGGDRNVQTIPIARTVFFGSPVWFNNSLFLDGDTIQGYNFNAADSTFSAAGNTNYGFTGRGSGLVVSARGTAGGILWSFSGGKLSAVRPESIAGAGAGNGVAPFYQAPLGDGTTVKFTHPVVINGKVYAANKDQFLGFGLLKTAKPVVTVAATGTDAAAAPGFVLTRTGAPVGDLVVTYTTGGTARSVMDFAALPGTVTIPDGAASAAVAVDATPGAQNDTTVRLEISPGSNYTVGTPSEDRVTIAGTLPAVSISATTAQAVSGSGSAGVFTLTRTGSTTGTLKVHYAAKGSGKPGVDYQALRGVRVFKAGQAAVKIRINPAAALPAGGTTTVKLVLTANENYTVGKPKRGTVKFVPAQ